MTSEEMNVLERAIKTYGEDAQIDKAIEEMSELIKALLKLRYARDGYERDIIMDSVDEEMADVQIMWIQLAMIFKNTLRVDAWQGKKIDRLDRRIRKDVKNG